MDIINKTLKCTRVVDTLKSMDVEIHKLIHY